MKTILLAAALAALPATALAQAFIAGSVGSAEVKDGCGGNASCDLRDTGGTLRAGYRFLPWLAVEARYIHLGDASARTTSSVTVDGTAFDVTSRTELRNRGAGVNAIFTWPVAPRLGLHGIAGVARMETKVSLSQDPSTFPGGSGTISVPGLSGKQKRTRGYYGLAASWDFDRDSAISIEADRYRLGLEGSSGNVDLVGVGFTHRFR